MDYQNRKLNPLLHQALARGKSVLLLGPRQTGKTTLIKTLAYDRYISLASLSDRLRYEKDITAFASEIRALAHAKTSLPVVLVDEIQKIPLLMDSVQELIDEKIAQFVLTGSSARKLRRRPQVNLLPGRVILLHLDPLTFDEFNATQPLLDWLLYGALPEIVLTKNTVDKDQFLHSYIATYLEEEILAEAVVRNLSHFAQFLELAAAEVGQPVNFSKLSQEIGIAHNTISAYYQILEDCLIVERIEPYIKTKTRRRLMKSHKYLMFDLGIRRMAASEGLQLPRSIQGNLFVQFIGLELLRRLRLHGCRAKLRYWRDLEGDEIDWVIEFEKRLIPIEVKFTDLPQQNDTKVLKKFLQEYPEVSEGFIICQTPHAMQFGDRITALPWQELEQVIQKLFEH